MEGWWWWRLPAAVTGFAGLTLLVAGGLSVDNRTASALTNCDVANYSLDAQESQFVSLLNSYRAENGLGALSNNGNLNRAAAWLVEDIGTNDYFSHTDSLGRSAYQRVIDCGYPGGAGENIAAGTDWDTAQEVFGAWKASSGHNANMLGTIYTEVGIARMNVPGSPYGWYWAADFGAGGGGGGAAPTNTPTRTPTRPNTPVPPSSLPLSPGANLVAWPGDDTPPAQGLGKSASNVSIIYRWDPETKKWQRYAPGVPAFVNTLGTLRHGEAYWVIAKGQAEVIVP